MPLFDWTTTGLPLPSVAFKNTVQSSVLRTKMDSGRTRQRRRFTSQNRLIPVSWELTDAEYALFQGVFLYKISSGADFFTLSLPLGDGFKTYTVRFTDDPLQTAYKDVLNWIVSTSLETQSGSPLTESEVNALLSP